jgi:hypothetical protein
MSQQHQIPLKVVQPQARPNYLEAPLVHLIDADPSKMNPTELQDYLTKLRELRGNAATRKAVTEQKPKAGGKGLDLNGLF